MANEAGRGQWNNPGYVAFWKGMEASVSALAEPLIGALKPHAGEHILDVGCGGGLTTLLIAQSVEPGGSATGFDISEPLLALANERAKESGTPNVSFVHGDAQTDDAPGGPFDAATSRLGVMFFGDPIVAFSNIQRHIKPGGRLVFLCFQETAANPWYPAEVLDRYAPPRPPSPYLPPSPFALGEKDRTTKILEAAGFSGLTFTPYVQKWDGIIDRQSAGGMVAPFQLPPERAQQAIAEINAHFDRNSTNGRDMAERNYWIIEGRRPR